MPKIVEYQRQVLPSGGAGGQIQPYKDAPPMYPLTDPAAAAKVRFLREIGDTAVDWMRLQEREQEKTEKVKANFIINENAKKQILAQSTWNEGVRELQAWNEDLIKSRRQELAEQKRDVLANADIKSDTVRYALGQALDAQELKLLNQMDEHIEHVKNVVAAGNIRADFEERKNNIVLGSTPEIEAKKHNAIVDINQPWNEGIKKEHLEKLRGIWIKQQATNKQAIEEARITGIYSQVLTDAKGDLEKALEIISDPKSIKKYDITMKEKNAIAESINQNLRIKNDNYKRFAEDVVGKATVKILNNTPIADIELEGLEPHDKAIVEKVRDYQDRQNRSENREKRSIERAKTTEDRQIAREKIFDAKVAKQEKSDEIEGQIRAKILNGDPIDLRADVYAKVPDGLKNDAANRLISMASKVQKDPKYKLGLVVLNKALSLGVIDSVTYGKAVIDFQDKVDAEQATGKRVIEIAEEIVNPKKANSIGEWLNNIFGNLGKTLLGKGKPEEKITQKATPSQTDLEFTAKKHGISVDEVKRRLGIK